MPNARPIQLSVVLPALNERENLPALFAEIDAALSPTFGPAYEIIVVDDGSTDGTGIFLEEELSRRSNLVVVTMRRRYGQSAAFDAGFRMARGRLIVTLDADGQNDPADIPRMIALMERDRLDFVAGIRNQRQDALLLRKVPSKIANGLIRLVTRTAIRDLGCSLKLYDRACVEDLHLYGEMHRFLSVLVESEGARTGQIDVSHRPRTRGQSKYGMDRALKVVLDLLTVWFLHGYSTKPIYVFGSKAMICFAAAIGCSGMVLYHRLFNGIFVHLQPLFIVGISFALVGVQFLSMGLLAEIQVRTLYEARDRPAYSVRSVRRAGDSDAGNSGDGVRQLSKENAAIPGGSER